MKTRSKLLSLIWILTLAAPTASLAKVDVAGITQRTAENQIRNLVEPILEKYCHDECKLLNVAVTVDINTPDEVAPGFDDVDPQRNALAPSSGRIKVLIDDKTGPVTRAKLIEFLQQYLDTLDYPIKVETQIAHFPQPMGSMERANELRDQVAKQFKNTLTDLFTQFCPEQCMLADFNIQTDVSNSEEAQYGQAGEYFQDGPVAIRIRNISGTILADDLLSPEEQANILEMARLKTNSYRHVDLTVKSIKFPHPGPVDANGVPINGVVGGRAFRGLASEQKNSTQSKTDANSTTNNTSNSRQDSNSNSTNKSSTNSTTSDNHTVKNNELDSKQEHKEEKFERFEKIERVENGDAVQAELQKFKIFGLIFGCSILSLLIFVAMATYRARNGGLTAQDRLIQSIAGDATLADARPLAATAASEEITGTAPEDRRTLVARRYEIERIIEDLTNVYAQQPRVAKHVFSRVLTEEGVEACANYIHILGEGIVVDMLRDPSLQGDLNELLEFYARTPIELTDEEKVNLLRKLHNRTIAGKLVVLGKRSSTLFDFLAEMDGSQIFELVRNESITVKAIIATQCDNQKRNAIYSQLDPKSRMDLLSELSRIDYLPRDYITNVASALKRKRKENPRLNTEALPGSEVLVSLLERTGTTVQRSVVQNLEIANPDSARNVKSKLVSLETLRYLRDGQLLEVVLSLKHEELLQFLKGSPDEIRKTIFSRAPKELVADLEEELTGVDVLGREAYQVIERKIINRIKVMANEGLLNLIETNDRMFTDGVKSGTGETNYIQAPRKAGGM